MRMPVIYATDSGLKTNHGGSIEVDSAYSEAFVNAINTQSDKTEWVSDYINEIFIYFYLRIMEFASVFTGYDAQALIVKRYQPVQLTSLPSILD